MNCKHCEARRFDAEQRRAKALKTYADEIYTELVQRQNRPEAPEIRANTFWKAK